MRFHLAAGRPSWRSALADIRLAAYLVLALASGHGRQAAALCAVHAVIALSITGTLRQTGASRAAAVCAGAVVVGALVDRLWRRARWDLLAVADAALAADRPTPGGSS